MDPTPQMILKLSTTAISVSSNQNSFYFPDRIIMQLVIRSKESYVLEFAGSESLSELKIRIAETERCEDVLLYVAGRPLDFEAEGLTVGALENFSVDVNIPLLGGKVRRQMRINLFCTVTIVDVNKCNQLECWVKPPKSC